MKQSFKQRLILGTLAKAALAAAVAGFSIATVIAQNPPVDRELQQARVGGSVSVEANIVSQLRRFEPNRRTYWHSHDGGFILFVQEGKARVQKRGEPMKELQPGEIDYTPPGVEHWHGSAPEAPLMQLGVVPFAGGVKFLEPVTDAQYNGESL
jgi:quercetin dioxygenase-like cupin family protein